MGSGCISNSSNSSSSNFGSPISDQVVKYTGPAIPGLGICTGDYLNEVEAALITAIVNYSTGVGINIPDIDLTACGLFSQFITCCNTCSSLDCLMSIIFQSLCTLYGDIVTLQNQITGFLSGYTAPCLSGITTNSTIQVVLQTLLTDYCILKAQVANLTTLVNNLTNNFNQNVGNFLATALTSCQGSGVMQTSGSGATFAIAFKGFTPVGGIMPYAGPIAGKFDSTGLGLAGTDCCGWALCNGATHGSITVEDYRGYFPVGVNDGSMGSGSQNPEVDNSVNPGQNYSLHGHGGAITVTLSGGQIPSVGVTGTLTDPGHDHVIFYKGRNNHAPQGGTNNYVDFTGPLGDNTAGTAPYVPPTTGTVPTAYVSRSKTGITTAGLTTGGGGGSHENRPPYKATYFIQRIA